MKMEGPYLKQVAVIQAVQNAAREPAFAVALEFPNEETDEIEASASRRRSGMVFNGSKREPEMVAVRNRGVSSVR